jgi:hypothetical protein
MKINKFNKMELKKFNEMSEKNNGMCNAKPPIEFYNFSEKKLTINEMSEENTNEFSPDKPYIVLLFKVGKIPGKEIILKSEPIWNMKEIHWVTQTVTMRNRVLGQMAGVVIEYEKHNFTKWEELPIEWKK